MAHTLSTTTANPGLSGAYIRLMDGLSSITAVIAAMLLLIGVIVVCYMIFGRYVLGESTTWQTEFAIFSITAAMLLGTPYVLMTGGHVAVTVLPDALGGVAKQSMRLISSLVGLAFCLALAWSAWLYVIEAYEMNWTTGSVWNPPLWPALLPMAIGISQLSLQYLAEILRGDTEHGPSH